MGAKCADGCSCGRHSAPHPGGTRPEARSPVDLEELRLLAPVLSQQEIAAALGVTRKVVQSRMREAGIQGRARVLSRTHAAKHKRLRKTRGKASDHQCARCDNAARDWAQVHAENGEDPWADYVPLCRSCHVRYDHDARWNKESLARWRATAGPSIAAAWTRERRAAIGQLAGQNRLANPQLRDMATGQFAARRAVRESC
jgi:hypothetical protein